MAVAFDAASKSATTGTDGSVSEGSFGWTHTPVGTPKAVAVFVMTNANADYITSVDYGGSTLTQVTGGEAIDTLGEPMRGTLFFLGSSIPTGAQTVTVTRTNNAINMIAFCLTATAATSATEIYEAGIVLLEENGTLAEQSVNDGSPGSNSLRVAAIASGLSTAPAVGANSTDGVSWGNALSTRSARLVYETTPGQGSRNVGFSSIADDDRAAVHFAIREIATGLTITSVNAGNDVYSGQTLVKVVGTGLSNVTSATYKGAACTAISKSSSLSITMTFPNFFTNNIKVGAQHALKIRG